MGVKTALLYYLTRRAYRPFLLIFMVFAIAESSGSKTITRPEKSSLKLGVLQLGQIDPVAISWQSRQAFSLNFSFS